MNLLETRDLDKHFGGLHVTVGVNLALPEGELHCLIGPNGAGKSTLFRLILGEYRPSAGHVLFAGEDITRLLPYQRIRKGISVKFQVPGIFRALGVRHNLEIALQGRFDGAALDREVARLLDFLNLADAADQPAGELSHGQKQWLEIGMAIALRPRLLLLDEPTAGMSPGRRTRPARW
jgi:branched-chain amino acid transport system ATP-binding protein